MKESIHVLLVDDHVIVRSGLAAYIEAEPDMRIVAGLSNKEIADKLGIADATARQHVSAILRKLGAEDRTQLAVLALREGYVRADHRFLF